MHGWLDQAPDKQKHMVSLKSIANKYLKELEKGVPIGYVKVLLQTLKDA
ncbi:hypothetical protein N9L68_07010 [bacterium]|nr:hypothetical protein [bacterium]